MMTRPFSRSALNTYVFLPFDIFQAITGYFVTPPRRCSRPRQALHSAIPPPIFSTPSTPVVTTCAFVLDMKMHLPDHSLHPEQTSLTTAPAPSYFQCANHSDRLCHIPAPLPPVCPELDVRIHATRLAHVCVQRTARDKLDLIYWTTGLAWPGLQCSTTVVPLFRRVSNTTNPARTPLDRCQLPTACITYTATIDNAYDVDGGERQRSRPGGTTMTTGPNTETQETRSQARCSCCTVQLTT